LSLRQATARPLRPSRRQLHRNQARHGQIVGGLPGGMRFPHVLELPWVAIECYDPHGLLTWWNQMQRPPNYLWVHRCYARRYSLIAAIAVIAIAAYLVLRFALDVPN